jgi:hypothetical protein
MIPNELLTLGRECFGAKRWSGEARIKIYNNLKPPTSVFFPRDGQAALPTVGILKKASSTGTGIPTPGVPDISFIIVSALARLEATVAGPT